MRSYNVTFKKNNGQTATTEVFTASITRAINAVTFAYDVQEADILKITQKEA